MPIPKREDKIAHIAAVIRVQEGHTISPESKGKNLNKFGTNAEVGTTFETVAEFQGTTANETFVTTNIIDSVSSSSASDTTQTLIIEGHTVDGSGNLTFVSQEAILNGQTKVTLTTPLARANRIQVKATGTPLVFPAATVGTVYIYDDTGGITAGVPNTAAATKIILQPGENRSEKCQTSTSQFDYWLLEYFGAGVGDAAVSVDVVIVRLETRDVANGGAWQPIGRDIQITPTSGDTTADIDFHQYVKPNHDLRVRAKTNAGTCAVFAEVGGWLATFT